LIRKYNPIYQK